MTNFTARIYDGISGIDREEWNRLALLNRTPFYEWEWLALLEESGSISPENGWLPFHLVLRSDETIVGAFPLYLKGHSHGEFVFDYGWADLARQLDAVYYPKLVGTSPATPSGHYRPLIDPRFETEGIVRAAADYLEQTVVENGLGGAHFLFADGEFGDRLEGYSYWKNQSYLWINRDYASFDDYLAEFGKNQRRNIRREWKSIAEQGLEIRPVTGDELTPELMELMYRYYLNTNGKFGPWAARFLNREFFLRLPEYVAHRTVLFAAVPPGAPVEEASGLSMCLYKGPWLFGRYWGSDDSVRNLHFSACYYAPMRWMIEKGLRYFDPGAGSPHKLRRGFIPHGVVSYHRYSDPNMRALFERHIDSVNRETEAVIATMEQDVPYREESKLAIRNEIATLFK